MAVQEMQTANTAADLAQKEPQLPPGPSTQAFPVPVILPLQAQPSKSAATKRHTVIERIDVQAAQLTLRVLQPRRIHGVLHSGERENPLRLEACQVLVSVLLGHGGNS